MYLSKVNTKIVMDEKALDISFTPPTLLHREKHISEILRLLLTNFTDALLLYGSTGSGKSASIKRVFRELRNRTLKLKPIYVNAWEHQTRFDILYELASRVYPVVPKRGTATSELLERIYEFLHKTGKRLVVCLDEVDKLKDTGVFYTLLQVKSALITISNDRFVLEKLKINPRIRSRMGMVEEIEFPAYSKEELKDILSQRAKLALNTEAVPDGVIDKIAGLVSQWKSGDARIALHMLKKAARLAEAEGTAQITLNHVEKAWSDAKRLSMARVMARLNLHQQVLYRIVQEGEIGTGKLYRRYREEIKESGKTPLKQVTYRKYMAELARLGLVVAKGEGRWRRYQIA